MFWTIQSVNSQQQAVKRLSNLRREPFFYANIIQFRFNLPRNGTSRPAAYVARVATSLLAFGRFVSIRCSRSWLVASLIGIMKSTLWCSNEKGHEDLRKSAQNLRDKLAYLERTWKIHVAPIHDKLQEQRENNEQAIYTNDRQKHGDLNENAGDNNKRRSEYSTWGFRAREW